MDPSRGRITIVPVAPDAPLAVTALRAFFADVVGRYHGRAAGERDVGAAMRDDPSDALAEPTGLLLVACHGECVIGCAGLRALPDGVGEVTRVWVAPDARRRGLATRMLRDLEDRARARGLTRLRLDTRSDLVESRALYARSGYVEIAPFNDGPYAEHWFAKELTGGAGER